MPASFHFALFAFFLAVSAVLFQIHLPGIAWVSLGVSIITAVHWILQKAKKTAGKAREKTAKKIDEEWAKIEKVEKAKASYPSLKVWENSLHELGKKAGEALMAKDSEKWSSPNPSTRIAKGSQNFIDAFLKVFKK